ncbi:MAG: prepilin-type N-terminal cleavage/methylation domain-containing protein [Candidatus Riflebacteria bacterium]|nr:prepilin-type N-terminal cleavage/methylation domain-containing protein [Candidatus Riflebacteria bacterium]
MRIVFPNFFRKANLNDAVDQSLRYFRSGFTLVEIVVVLVIFSAIVYFSLPTIEFIDRHGKEIQLKVALQETREAIDKYREARNSVTDSTLNLVGSYPPSIASLLDEIPPAYCKSGANPGPFLANLPLNYFIGKFGLFKWYLRSAGTTPDTSQWGLSYDPKAIISYGVYDIKFAPEEATDSLPFRTDAPPAWNNFNLATTSLDGSNYWDW